jgi:branched-chain amino acid transport system substrate-binding protein
MTMKRRSFLAAAGAAGLTSTLTIARARAQASAASGPIKLPVVMPLSGTLAVVGMPVKLGAELTAARINKAGGVNGRPLELVFRDDQGKPDMTAAAAREFSGPENGRIIISGLITPAAMSLMSLAEGTDQVLLTMAASGMPITHELFNRRVFRTSDNDHQRILGLSRIAAERYPNVLNWHAIVLDGASWVAGAEMFKNFITKAHAAKGRQVKFGEVHKVKFGTADFRSQLSQIASSDAEGLYHVVPGSDAVTFWQQATAFGLQKKLKCVTDQSIDFATAGAMKKNLPTGLWSNAYWYDGLYKGNNASNEIAAAVKEQTKTSIPSGYVFLGNATVQAAAEAYRAARGDLSSAAIIRALESGLKIQTIKGELTYRKEDHQGIADVNFVNQVGRDGDPGFAVAASMRVAGNELVEPPTPGTAYAV